MTRGAAVRGLALLASALLLAGCTGGAANQGGTGYYAPDGSTVIVTSDNREAAPQVTGKLLDGAAFDLAGWRGQIVVVNFWASWCQPCMNEAAALDQTYQQTNPKGVQFLGVAVNDTVDNAQGFLDHYEVPYKSLIDDPSSGDSIVLDFRGKLPVGGQPTTYVLDRQGRIAARALGEVDYSQLLGMIESVQKDPG